ncbi:MAG: family 10 glycosylhydrolase [Lentisphaerota bacterium]
MHYVKIKKLRCVLVAVGILGASHADILADDATDESIPEFAASIYSPNTKWTVTPSAALIKEEDINDVDHGKGKSFTIDMSKVTDRFTIRLSGFSADISQAGWAGAWMKVSNREPFSAVNIYAFTAKGCFKRSLQYLGSIESPWLELGVSAALASNKNYYEGSPKWDEPLQAINFCGWKSKSISTVKEWRTTVTIAGFAADKRSGVEKEFTIPKAEQAMKKPVRRNVNGVLLETRPLLVETGVWLDDGVDVALDKTERSGHNVFVPCVWRGIGTIYRSENEQKIDYRYEKYFIGDKDPIKELIEKAHARGIEVHAWFCVAMNNAGYAPYHPEFKEPGSPANAFDMQNPAFRNFIVKEIVDFVKKYNVDGICLDYIRTAGISFSKTAAEIYQQKYGTDISELKGTNWMSDPALNKRLLDWQEAAVSDVVKRVSEGVRAIKPGLIITTCGLPLPKPQLHEEGRNEWLWLEKGWIDVAYDMDYGSAPGAKLLQVRAAQPAYADRYAKMLGIYSRFPSAKNIIKVEGDMLGSRSGTGYANAVEYSLRKFYGTGGVATYWYENLNKEISDALKTGTYKEKALPAWKENYKK